MRVVVWKLDENKKKRKCKVLEDRHVVNHFHRFSRTESYARYPTWTTLQEFLCTLCMWPGRTSAGIQRFECVVAHAFDLLTLMLNVCFISHVRASATPNMKDARMH